MATTNPPIVEDIQAIISDFESRNRHPFLGRPLLTEGHKKANEVLMQTIKNVIESVPDEQQVERVKQVVSAAIDQNNLCPHIITRLQNNILIGAKPVEDQPTAKPKNG